MKEMYSGEQAKAIDTHAIDTMGMPSLVLMEKAAMSVVWRKPDHRILFYVYVELETMAVTASVWHVSYMKWDIRRQLQS